MISEENRKGNKSRVNKYEMMPNDKLLKLQMATYRRAYCEI